MRMYLGDVAASSATPLPAVTAVAAQPCGWYQSRAAGSSQCSLDPQQAATFLITAPVTLLQGAGLPITSGMVIPVGVGVWALGLWLLFGRK